MDDIVELLTERRKFRYAGDCKCGKCCLVPHEMLCSAIDEIKRLRSSPPSDRGAVIEEVDEVARAIWNTKPGSKIHPWASLGSIRELYAEEARAVIAVIDRLRSTPPKDSGK